MCAKHLRAPSRFSELERKGQCFASYCSHLRRRNVSPRTLETYADCLLVFARWLDEAGIDSPRHATPSVLESFRLWLTSEYDRRISPSRQGTYIAVLRSFYKWMLAERLILSDPASNLKYPKIAKRIHRDILTPAELRRLLNNRRIDAPQSLRDLVALRLLALSGPRASELVGINIEDVSLPDREIIIRKGKGRKDRLIFFDRDTREHIARYLVQVRPFMANDNERALIVGENTRRMTRDALLDLVKRHGTRIRRAITPHSLRRTFCTLMLKAGANIKVIGELAGHSSLKTTARYTKIDIGELSRVYMRTHPRGGDR